MTHLVYLYVHDTMSDWEHAYLLPEIVSGRFLSSQDQRYQLRLCGRTMNSITTMGGIRLVPEMTIEDIKPTPDSVLILVGSNTWMDPVQDQVLAKVRDLLRTEITIGAICGATIGLARAGLLNNRPHTSNDLAVLKEYCPEYIGDAYYLSKPAVTDKNLITASGLAAVEFAYEVMKKMGVMRKATLEAWYHLYLHKKPEYFYQLMESLKD